MLKVYCFVCVCSCQAELALEISVAIWNERQPLHFNHNPNKEAWACFLCFSFFIIIIINSIVQFQANRIVSLLFSEIMQKIEIHSLPVGGA